MKNQISERRKRLRIPWNLIGQIVLAVTFFYLLGRLINSLSFAGANEIDIRATEPISASGLFDNFGFKVFDVKWNESTWAEIGAGSHIQQFDGILILSRETEGSGGLIAHRRKWLLSQIDYVESRLILNSDIQTQAGGIGIELNTVTDGDQWFAKCGIQGSLEETMASILCNTADGFSTTAVKVPYDTWHLVRFDVDAEDASIKFFVNGEFVGEYIPQDANKLKNAEYLLTLNGNSSDDGSLTGSFDNVQLKNK